MNGVDYLIYTVSWHGEARDGHRTISLRTADKLTGIWGCVPADTDPEKWADKAISLFYPHHIWDGMGWRPRPVAVAPKLTAEDVI